jgi:predicted permease
MAFYRALLRLLPRDRRRRHGAEMAVVFDDLAAEARRADSRRAVAALWTAETIGLLRFSWREWTSRVGRGVRSILEACFDREPGPPLGAELRWAWRALRTRGWRGVLVVGLLAVAMAANAVVFASADSFVFNRVPYRAADRLVEIGPPNRFGWNPSVWPELVPVWRAQHDIFEDFQAHTGGGVVYLAGGDDPRYVIAEAVTPGLLEMLGARPLWGRSFTGDDVQPGAPPVAMIAEDEAAKEFGDARSAMGHTLAIGKDNPRIVGVMRTGFRFPSGQMRIWVPLNLATMRERYLATPIGRLAPGLSIDLASRAIGDRAPALASFVKVANQTPKAVANGRPEARPIAPALVDPRLKRLFALLVAAAASLLLVACANVINLELGAAVGRARTLAVSLALGASRATLVRTVLLEGALLVAGAAAIATVVTWEATAFIAVHLPVSVTSTLANPIAVHLRTIVFMTMIAAGAWLLASLPVAVVASRADVLDVIRLDGRSLSTSRGGVRLRHLLTAAEVALTVPLLIGASLSVRTYVNLLNLPTGFDAADVVTMNVRQSPSAAETAAALQERILGALRARPDVAAAAVADASPPTMGGSGSDDLKIGSDPTPLGQVTLAEVRVEAEYFKAIGLPILRGRSFEAGALPGSVVVDEAFARKFWSNGDAVGATFSLGGVIFDGAPTMTIVGVAAHLRTDRDSVTEPSSAYFPLYLPLQTTAKYVPLSFVARLKDGGSADGIRVMVRALAPTARVRVERMTDRYAATFADEQLASSIMSAFGSLAFVVAAAGVYGVMAFLVAGRTREIGIRMALGADRSAVRRLVLQSSMPPVIGGAVVGLIGAAVAMHWVGSLYFGVASMTPATFVGVTLLVVLTATLATWPPARQAGRVDPSRLFRE